MLYHTRKAHQFLRRTQSFLKFITALANLKCRNAETRCNFEHIGKHRFADAAFRHIYNSLKPYIIGRVIDDCKIRNNILDFLTVKEPVSTDDFMRNSAFGECDFKIS